MAKSNEIWKAAYSDMRVQKRRTLLPAPSNNDSLNLPDADDIFSAVTPVKAGIREEPVVPDPDQTAPKLNAIGGVFARFLNEVQMQGTNPDVAIYKLIRENQVLLFCQSNAALNSFREFGARLMPGLARRGATHLIIERPEIYSADYSRLVLSAEKAGIKVESISARDTDASKLTLTALAAISKAL